MSLVSFIFVSILVYFLCAFFLTLVLWNEFWKKQQEYTVEDILFTMVDVDDYWSFMPDRESFRRICKTRYIPVANLVVSIMVTIVFIYRFIYDCASRNFKK